MGLIQIQTDFTHGELGPLMRGRYDTSLYLKAAERMTNVLVVPQGAAIRRFGTNFVDDIGITPDEYQIFNFLSVEGENFLLLLTDLLLRIFREDGTEHPSSNIVFPFTGTQLKTSQIRYAQTHDEAIFVQIDTNPQALRFNPTTDTFSTLGFTFKNAPTFDFQDLDYSGINFLLSVVEAGQVGTITASSPIFDAEHIGGTFIYIGTTAAAPLGLARINSLVDSTIANITIINDFAPNAKVAPGAPGRDAVLEKVALSTTRGFPRSVTFYENRLLFGGSKSLPQTLFMSQIGDYRDFRVGPQANDAIVATISSNQSSNINHLVADKTLQVFTERGEFAPPQSEDTALTPTSISIRKQSSIGTSDRVQPVVIDNNTFYIQKGGRAVLAFVFNEDTIAYQSIESSTIANHLIADVIDMTTLQGRSESDANFLFLVNAAEVKRIDETIPAGSLTSFQTLREQDIQAWTLITTKVGKFKRVQSVGETVFFIIERLIDGVSRQYLEKSDFDSLTDSNLKVTFGAPQQIVGGLDHLDGEEVDIIADGFALAPQTVTDGEIEVETAATTFEIGLAITTEIRTMPINVESNNGPLLVVPKRLPRYFIDLLDSQGIEVNGILIPNLLFSEEFITGPMPLVSGLFEIRNLDGWDRRQTVTLTQNGPFKMTILGIGYEVEI